MSKRITLLLIVICLIELVSVSSAKASSDQPLTQEEVFAILQKAFQAQTSLTSEFRTYAEVQQILAPYFHSDYAKTFLEENLIKEKEGYIVYGSDFALYFIPFYSYTDETRIVYDQKEDKFYVYELFKAPEAGPVAYKDHYEVITIEKINSNWLITDLQLQDEAPIVEKKSKTHKEANNVEESVLTWNPFKVTIYSLLEMEIPSPMFLGRYNNIF